MSPKVCSVSARLETEEAVQALEVLSQASERSLEVRNRLLGFPDIAQELRFVHVEGHSAVTRDAFVLRLELSDGLAELVAAVRAGQFDAM